MRIISALLLFGLLGACSDCSKASECGIENEIENEEQELLESNVTLTQSFTTATPPPPQDSPATSPPPPQDSPATSPPPTQSPPAVSPPSSQPSFAKVVDVFPHFDHSMPLPGANTSEAVFPEFLIPYKIEQTETWITRVSDNDVFGLPNGQAIHLYSKHQPWNVDETMLDIGGMLLRADTFEPLREIPVTTARSWSNTRAEVIVGLVFNPINGGVNRLVEYDIYNDSVSELGVFDDYHNCTMGSQEGGLSADDRYVVLACENQDGTVTTLLSYDMIERSVIGKLQAAENYNWAAISPSGRYILIENNRDPEPNPQLIRYSRNFTESLALGRPAHGDFGSDQSGNEVYVMIDSDRFYYFNLESGIEEVVQLHPENYPIGHGHLSCRNTFRPGWCYFSSNSSGRVGAIRIDPNKPEVEAWGYHYSSAASYSRLPKATVNRSGTQVLVTSDWFGQGHTSDYILSVTQPLR